MATATTSGAASATVRRGLPFAAWVAVSAVVAGLPWLGAGGGTTRQVILIALLALIVSGLNLSRGYAGELALGQAALYAGGAYVTGYVAVNHVNDLALTLLIAAGVALLLGIISGVPGLRLGGWMLAIASFYLVLLIPDVVNVFPKQLGGFNGLTGVPRPRAFGVELDDRGFYVVVVAVTALWFGVFRNLIRSPHGAAFLVLRESPVLAQSLGIPSYSMKLKAYALGAVPAGLAGCLFAYLDGFIHPGTFSFELAILVLAASVIGGAESVYGALWGAALLEIARRQFDTLRDYQLVLYGALLVLGGVAVPDGLAGAFSRLWAQVGRALRRGTAELPEVAAAMPGMPGTPLRVRGVGKSFGGNQALVDVDLVAEPKRVTALIGPNGSGKTTLLNVIGGYYDADQGTVTLGDERLSGKPPHAIARLGVARTFQTPNVPSSLSVREVVETGRYSHHRTTMFSAVLRLPRSRRVARDNATASRELLGALGILKLERDVASHLSLGTRRLVELARALATRPSLLLLDEVASGLDENELEELAAIVRRVRDAGTTVVLVEHNFSLVRALADTVYVLADGAVIATGTPEEIAAHPEVLQRYLGEPLPSGVDAPEPVARPLEASK